MLPKVIFKSNEQIYSLVVLILGAIVSISYYLYRPDNIVFILLSGLYVVVLALALRTAFDGQRQTSRRFSFVTIPLFMVLFWQMMHMIFADFNIHAIMHHAVHGLVSIPLPAVFYEIEGFYLAGAVIVGILLLVYVRKSRLLAKVDYIVCLPLIIVNPLAFEVMHGLGLTSKGQQILQSYYQPVHTVEQIGPSRPNIIHLFLESAELTLANESEFGPAMAPIMEFKNKGLFATNIRQINNTEWTMAGMVAANCGVPLIQPWLARAHQTNDGADSFLPHANCLGDVLADNGYWAQFIMGAPTQFGGTDSFYLDHGFDKIEAFTELRTLYPDHHGRWGIADGAVFDHAEKTIRQLSTSDQPYLVTMTSIGGHFPNGIPSPECLNGEIDTKSTIAIGVGVECANVLARNMIYRLEKDGHLNNTIVIIQSDHLLMQTQFTEKLDEMERRNLFMVFGPGIGPQKIDKPAAMIDVYPTLLEILGYKLPEHSAGLGRSLISDAPALVEELGPNKLDDAIRYDSALRRFLWLGEGIDDGLQTAATE